MNTRKETRRIAEALERLSNEPRSRDTSRTAKREPKDPFTYRLRVKFMTSPEKSRAATAARRQFPIMAYVGPNGGGKSLAMVKDSLPSLAAGRKVLSTVRLLDATTGQPHNNYIAFTDWEQLLEARDCDVLMDEMVGIAGARESQKLDVRVQNILVQLRRRNVVLRWSAPNWLRADKIVREVTQAVTECRGYYADRRQTSDMQLWAPKRLFSFKTYDTLEFEEWTSGRRDSARAEVTEWFKGPGSPVFSSYDTMDAVERVTGADEGGRCTNCWGTVPRPKPCSCPRDSAGRHVPLELVDASTALDQPFDAHLAQHEHLAFTWGQELPRAYDDEELVLATVPETNETPA